MRAALIALAVLFAAGCMEVEQANVGSGKKPGQSVKRDTPAWSNESLPGGPKWTKGDAKSWEAQIKNRQLVQNESVRIGN